MPEFRPYQLASIDFLAGRRHALLAHEMRVGKTACAVGACEKIGAENILVVCPAIAVPHWHREFDRWTEGRLSAWIMSYDRLRLDWDRIRERQTFDVAIVDECHFAKTPEAKRTKLIYGKGGLGWISDRMWAISGTPAPKHAGELWPMLKAFGVVGMTYDEFLRYYCVVDGLGIVRGTRVAKIPELRAILSKIMLRRTRKQVAPEMPGIDFQFLEVKPTSDADLNVPSNWLSDDRLVDWLETHQVANRDDRIEVAMAKVDSLCENISFAIENGLLKQTVAFGWHVEPLVTLAAKLNALGIRTEVLNGSTTPKQKERIQDNFRNGLTQVIAGNIMTCGTAIDLSSARHAYFLELDWVSGNNVQAASRMISMDKLDGVTVDVVTWPGSTDDRVQSVLMRRVRELSQLY